MSRIYSITDSHASGGSDDADYTYLGADTIVETAYPQVAGGLNLNYDPNGNNTYPDLDRFGRVLQQFWTNNNGIVLDGYSYTYDAVGNVLSKQYIVAGGPTISDTYSYDSLDRLISTTLVTTLGGGGTTNYSLDALGNQYNVNAANEIQATAGIATPTYDAAGNMTSDGNYTYVYNAWNRQMTVSTASGTTMATYSYDGLGRRITKSVYNSAGTAVLTTTDDYYDESGQVVEEQTHSGVGALVSTTQYVWDVSYVDSPVLRFQTPVGGSTQTLYYMWDANHNITGLVDPTTGKVVERYVYDPYGKVTVCHGNDGGSAADWTPLVSGGSSSAASPSVYSAYGNEVMFAGYMYDAETAVVYGGSLIAAGNYHADNREFITSISTWDIQDPMGYAAGDANLYRYCGDQPTIATDPSGLWEHVRNDQWKSNKDDETFMDLAEIILRIWPGITSRFHSVWGMTR